MSKIILRTVFLFTIICGICLQESLERIPNEIRQNCMQSIERFSGQCDIRIEGRDVRIHGTAPSETACVSIERAILGIQGIRRLKMDIDVHPDTLVTRQFRALSHQAILFEKNSDVIRELTTAILDTVSIYLKQHPRYYLILSGFADAAGDSMHNQVLSEKRALAVQKALVDRGCSLEKIEASGHGVHSSEPELSLSDAARRVEFKFKERDP